MGGPTGKEVQDYYARSCNLRLQRGPEQGAPAKGGEEGGTRDARSEPVEGRGGEGDDGMASRSLKAKT